MISAYRHSCPVNTGKAEQLIALFPAFRSALTSLSSMTLRELLSGGPLMSWRVMTGLPFEHRLSARQMKSAQNMVYSAVSGWQELLVNRVRELVTCSELPDDKKTVLYRVNARKAWWVEELALPWIADTETGELVPYSGRNPQDNPDVVFVPVPSEDLRLARRLVKQAKKRHRYPDLSRVNTLILDSIVAKPTESKNATMNSSVGWWVRTATLAKGKPVSIPLSKNTYFNRKYRETINNKGRLCGTVQLHLTRDRHNQPSGIGISLVTESPDAETRKVGEPLGVDFGVSSALFATSDGRLTGHQMLARLKELDLILTPYTAELQKNGTRLKTDPYYQQLQRRISDFVTNEIGRLLNRIAVRDGDLKVAELVVEELDFRGGGLSKRMNRIITRTGRGVLKTRLRSLTEKYGITVTEVPSPYTSQECSGCGYTTKTNRNGNKFCCRFCGLKLHADVNAARVVLSRRSRHFPGHTGPRSRRNTLRALDTAHRERWAGAGARCGPRPCRGSGLDGVDSVQEAIP